LPSLASCGQKLGYGNLKVGENFLKAAKSYSKHDCQINLDTKNCVINDKDETIFVSVNKDELIYTITAYSLVDGLTFNQVTEKFAMKYGKNYESHTSLNWEPKGFAKWCFNEDCTKLIAVSYFNIDSPRVPPKTDEGYFTVHPCDKLFKGNEKCGVSTNYIEVEYSDYSIPRLWIDKQDKQLNRF
jgi:hypothetical protein